MVRVAVFDDSREQRDGLEAVLGSVPEVEFAGSFPSARHVVRDVEDCAPHVVLMDIDMPEVDGIEAVGRLRERFPDLRIIMRSTRRATLGVIGAPPSSASRIPATKRSVGVCFKK